jgi:hypothetical protein
VSDDRLAAFGDIPADAEGADGLDLATGEIIKVPTLGLNSSWISRDVSITLSADGSAVVTDQFRLRGGAARQFRNIWDMADEEAQKWAVNAVCADITGTELLDWKHSDFGNANPEETLSFTYRIPNLAQVGGDFLILRLPNAKYAPTDVGRPTRRYGLFWRGSEHSDITFTVRAPQGYSVYATRDGFSKEGQGWRFAGDFRKSDDGSTLVFRENWSRDAAEAAPDAYQPYRQALITRGILRKEMLVFRK